MAGRPIQFRVCNRIRQEHMSRLVVLCLLFVFAGGSALAQTASPSSEQPSSSRAQPDSPPSPPPDAPMPDAGTPNNPPPKSKSKKLANKFDPHCIDVIFHACWSSPAPPPQGNVLTEEQKRAQEVSKDIEVGYYYLNEKNYIAAESRLKEAVELDPDSAAALIGLGQAQQRLGRNAEARESYEAYLKLSPDSADAQKVKKALAELQK